MPTTAASVSDSRQQLADHLHTIGETGRPIRITRYRDTIAALAPMRHRSLAEHTADMDTAAELSVRDARADWSQLLQSAAEGTPTVITSNGRPAAALIPPDWL